MTKSFHFHRSDRLYLVVLGFLRALEACVVTPGGVLTLEEIRRVTPGVDWRRRRQLLERAVRWGALLPCADGWRHAALPGAGDKTEPTKMHTGDSEPTKMSVPLRVAGDKNVGGSAGEPTKMSVPGLGACHGVGPSPEASHGVGVGVKTKEVSKKEVNNQKEKSLEKPQRAASVVAPAGEDTAEEIAAMIARSPLHLDSPGLGEGANLRTQASSQPERQSDASKREAPRSRKASLGPAPETVRPMRWQPMGRLVTEDSAAKALRRLSVDADDYAKRDELFRLTAGLDEGFLGRAVWGTERAMEKGKVDRPYAYVKTIIVRQIAAQGLRGGARAV